MSKAYDLEVYEPVQTNRGIALIFIMKISDGIIFLDEEDEDDEKENKK